MGVRGVFAMRKTAVLVMLVAVLGVLLAPGISGSVAVPVADTCVVVLSAPSATIGTCFTQSTDKGVFNFRAVSAGAGDYTACVLHRFGNSCYDGIFSIQTSGSIALVSTYCPCTGLLTLESGTAAVGYISATIPG